MKRGVLEGKSNQVALTRAQLDMTGEPGEMTGLSSTCHDTAPVYAVYEHSNGCLVLICAACRSFVARIQVAGDERPKVKVTSKEVH